MAINSSRAFALGGVVVAGLLTAAANVGAFNATTDASATAAANEIATTVTGDRVALTSMVGPQDLQIVVDASAGDVAVPAASNATVYRLGDTGSVTVEADGGTVVVTDLSPAPGWTGAAPDDGVASSAYAVFSDDALVVEFRVTDVDGTLVPAVGARVAG